MLGTMRAALRGAGLVAVMTFGIGLPQDMAAQTPETVHAALAQGAQVVRIRDHRGGYLPRVVAEVAAMNGAGVAGRIDGAFCFSACTIYLSLQDVCVAPWTQFGFHAPRDARSGRHLSGAAFDHATSHVARYYRPALAAWWMHQGRHVRKGMAFRTGADLIAMGYRACAPQDGRRTG